MSPVKPSPWRQVSDFWPCVEGVNIIHAAVSVTKPVFFPAPCSLSAVTAVSQCHNSTILVMWDLMEGGEGNTVYSAMAEAQDHTYLSCNITGTSCYLYGAQCDSRYSIIVSASSDQCSSLRSPPYRISMGELRLLSFISDWILKTLLKRFILTALFLEPCPPTNVAAHTSCEEESALVSWSPSPVAKAYHVIAVGEDGHNRTCNTTSTNCTLSQLLCEQQYTVFVTASHENCTSQASTNVTISTGICLTESTYCMCECNPSPSMTAWYLIQPWMIFSTRRPLPAWRPISEISLQQPVCAVVMGIQTECCRILRLCTEWKRKQVALSEPNYHLHIPGSRLWNSL